MTLFWQFPDPPPPFHMIFHFLNNYFKTHMLWNTPHAKNCKNATKSWTLGESWDEGDPGACNLPRSLFQSVVLISSRGSILWRCQYHLSYNIYLYFHKLYLYPYLSYDLFNQGFKLLGLPCSNEGIKYTVNKQVQTTFFSRHFPLKLI